MLRYRLNLEPDDNGTILVTSPDLPIVTFGENKLDAIGRAPDAIMAILASLIDAREEVPVPDFDTAGDPDIIFLSPTLQTEMKVRLHNALLAAGMTRADLQRRLGWKRESVDRLFRLDHGSRLDQLEQAFKALDKQIGVMVQDAPRDLVAA